MTNCTDRQSGFGTAEIGRFWRDCACMTNCRIKQEMLGTVLLKFNCRDRQGGFGGTVLV